MSQEGDTICHYERRYQWVCERSVLFNFIKASSKWQPLLSYRIQESPDMLINFGCQKMGYFKGKGAEVRPLCTTWVIITILTWTSTILITIFKI